MYYTYTSKKIMKKMKRIAICNHVLWYGTSTPLHEQHQNPQREQNWDEDGLQNSL